MISAPAFDIEIEESDTVLAVTERTKPIFPTYGPGDGRSWAQYYVDMGFSRKATEEDVSEAEEPEVAAVITKPGAWLQDPSKANGSAGVIARRLLAQGWDVRVQTSEASVPAVLYMSDSKEDSKKEYRKGDVRFEGHDQAVTSLIAVKKSGEHVLACEATWFSKGGFQGATTHDPILGREWRSTVTTPRKPRDWEAAEGLRGALGFGQWLDIVAPKPEKKTKGAKK